MVQSPQDGQGRARFDVTQTRAGTYLYTATLQPGGATAHMSASVRAGAAHHVKLISDLYQLPADGVSQTMLSAEVQDVYGNRLSWPGYTIRFSNTSNNGALQPFTDVPVTNPVGVATYRVTAGRVAGPETVEARVEGLPPATITITTQGVPHSLRLRYPDPDGPVGRAGAPVTVAVDVLDTLGNVVNYEATRQITLTVRSLATGAETAYTVTATPNRPAVFAVNRPQAGTYALKAESAGVMKALSAGYGGSVPDLVLQSGATLGLKVVPDLTRLQNDGGVSYSLVTVQLVDGNQNVTPNQTGLPMVVTLSLEQSTAAAGYLTVDDLPGGFMTRTRTVTILPGASVSTPVKLFSGTTQATRTIAASTADGMKASASVTMGGVGAPAKIALDPVQRAVWEPWLQADSAVTGQTVTVTLQDSKGNRQTGFAGVLSFSAGDSDAVLVAVLDPVTQTWVSLDQAPGNGGGDYKSTGQVPVDRGRAVFRIRSGTPGTKVFKVTEPVSGLEATILSQLDGPMPAALEMDAGTGIVAAGGSQLAITVRVVDANGAVVRGVTGPVTLQLSTGTAGRLIETVVELRDGVATAYFQSTAEALTASVSVTVFASVPFLSTGRSVTITVTP